MQDKVKKLRDMIEESGYKCWMDISQIGGGDLLKEKIAEGIRDAKVSRELRILCHLEN